LLRTENDAITLIKNATTGLNFSRVVVGKADSAENTITRKVTFFCITSSDIDIAEYSNELTKLALTTDRELNFSGYDHGMAHGDSESYFFFITANITPRLN
jgi:hypothetical protein